MSLTKSGGGAHRALTIAAAAFFAIISGAAAQTQPSQAPSEQTLPPSIFDDQPAPVIQSIAISGNQRIEPETVASYLPVQAGMPAEQELLDISLKTLFNTGLFSDVKLEMQEDGTLVIDVKENPIVNRVIFEGNKKVKEDKITEEIQLAPRIIYTRAKVQADTQKIIEMYRAKGRFAATVTPKVKPLEQNRIDVIFEIDEGPKTGIAKVNFVGNEVFTDNELRGEILTKESRWWRFFSSNDNFDPDKLEYERELLRQFYGSHGYADFSVLSAVAELTPDRKDFFITFTVEEGKQYTVGQVEVKTTLAKLDGDVLERYVPMKEGAIYDSEKIEKSVEALTFATGLAGYAFVDVNPQLVRHAETNTIDIIFQVNEGPRVYIERINIKGNTRTLDKVIRREIRVTEGDAFNRVLVDRSKARVKSLGFFKEVEIEERPGSAPDRSELDVVVQEQATGSFSVGVGVSSTENFILDFSIEERNLMGRGQMLRLQAQASSRTRNINVQFTQPYFLDRNLTAGFSAFNQRTNYEEAGYIRNRIGFGLNTGFQISEYGRGGLSYLLTRDHVFLDPNAEITITDLDGQVTTVKVNRPPLDIGGNEDPADYFLPGVTDYTVTPLANGDQRLNGYVCDYVAQALSPTCQSQGKYLTSLLGASVSFDTRDDPIVPRRGWRAGLSVRFAGVGGDVNYYQVEGNAAYYKHLFAGFVGSIKGRAGLIEGYGGDDVRLSDRFFEGASSFRGFEISGVGPRYLSNRGLPRLDSNNPDAGYVAIIDDAGNIRSSQAIGGKMYAIGTAEILLPLPLPDEYGIRASIFSDFGTVGLVDSSAKALNDYPIYYLNVPALDENGAYIRDDTGAVIIDQVLAPIQDDMAIRITAGVSINWNSPFGPIRFDIAEVIRKEIYDQSEGFRFSAGTNF